MSRWEGLAGSSGSDAPISALEVRTSLKFVIAEGGFDLGIVTFARLLKLVDPARELLGGVVAALLKNTASAGSDASLHTSPESRQVGFLARAKVQD